MTTVLPLKKMSFAEKLHVMEEIWTDLSWSHSEFSPPDWHGKVLEERRKKLEEGEIGFTDWEVAKKEIRNFVS